jgi:hypothetical protein
LSFAAEKSLAVTRTTQQRRQIEPHRFCQRLFTQIEVAVQDHKGSSEYQNAKVVRLPGTKGEISRIAKGKKARFRGLFGVFIYFSEKRTV